MYKLSWHTTLAISLLALMAFVFYRWINTKQYSLAHVPIVEFTDGDNSAERYIRDSELLLHQGYLKVCLRICNGLYLFASCYRQSDHFFLTKTKNARSDTRSSGI
jgi:hypothetical protein